MNIQAISQFFEKMSGNPGLQKEFVEFGARHGIDLSDDQLSGADLASVAAGADDLASIRLQAYMDQRQKVYETLSNVMKQMSDTSSSIVANMK